jgi:serine protease AprX
MAALAGSDTSRRTARGAVIAAAFLAALSAPLAVPKAASAAPAGGPPVGVLHATGAKWSTESGAYSMADLATATGAQSVWAMSDPSGQKITGNGIGVALIDSGITPVTGLTDPGKVINGPDLSVESQASNLRHLDTFGHGTHMAGIIAGHDPGVTDTTLTDPTKFVGIAPDAHLINLKVAAADGAADVSQVIAAIDWTVTHRNDPGLNIRVINLSYGTDSSQDPRLDPLSHAVESAWRNGIVVVAAAGNEGATATQLTMPAQNPYVIAVGASDPQTKVDPKDDTVSTFSSRGNATRHADLLAPGKSVTSLRDPGSYIDVTYPTGLVPGDTTGRFFRGSGTSQATAVLSGAAALLLQQRPTLTPDQVKRLLTSSANPMKKADPISAGAGTLNVATAAAAATPAYTQTSAASTGTGSLEQSRGGSHIADPTTGVELTGEQDIMGHPWTPATWAPAAHAGQAWSGGTWNGNTWAGSSWTGTSWTTRTWNDTTWTARTWSGTAWSGRIWD